VTILPDFQSTSHLVLLPLMLPAPKIAGLLAAGPHPNPSPARRGAEPEAVFHSEQAANNESALLLPFPLRGKGPGIEGFSPTELVYDDPRLADLLPWAFADFRREVFTLLESAVSLLTGEADRQQFAEANVRFNGQMALLYKLLIPSDQQTPLPIAKTRAELDEEMDAIRQQARQRLIDQYEAITRRQAERRAYREGRAQP